MSDWRYWITYEGVVQAEDEATARVLAFVQIAASLDPLGGVSLAPTVEVEEVGEG